MKLINNRWYKTVTCAWCGKEFETSTRKTKFCSNAHRQAAYRNRSKVSVTVKA
jgi:hypothetical protein